MYYIIDDVNYNGHFQLFSEASDILLFMLFADFDKSDMKCKMGYLCVPNDYLLNSRSILEVRTRGPYKTKTLVNCDTRNIHSDVLVPIIAHLNTAFPI